jgi:hypothetical protein
VRNAAAEKLAEFFGCNSKSNENDAGDGVEGAGPSNQGSDQLMNVTFLGAPSGQGGELQESRRIENYLETSAINNLRLLGFAAIMLIGTVAGAQSPPGPSQDVEQITEEAQKEPEQPATIVDRPFYRSLQDFKKGLSQKYGVDWALEDTVIYQATSGGIDPNDAMVNTLGLFATWKIIRAENGKDFGGLGFQAEVRGNHRGEFTAMQSDIGSLWSPNDSTSDDYSKINQLWWGQKFDEGKLGFQIGKIDPGSIINGNRFAGSGNTQFFGQPFATNPARSFADNGMGFQFRAEPMDWLYVHVLMSDGDAVSTHSPFTTIQGNWLYAGEVGVQPTLPNLGKGVYRFMLYQRENEFANEVGWSISADQNLSKDYGVFLRYGGNDAGINTIEHLVSAGFSFLQPFGRVNDETGIAASFTHPADPGLRDEYSGEVYYRLQLAEGLEVSASTQLILNPSAGDEDQVGVFGLRARLLY